MSAHFAQSNRLVRLAAACVAIAGAVACSDDSPTADPNAQMALTLGDTITGSGQLSELQQHRAAWLLRGIDDYRFQLQISCFCGAEITRPVVIEVHGGAIATVEDLATGSRWPTCRPIPRSRSCSTPRSTSARAAGACRSRTTAR